MAEQPASGLDGLPLRRAVAVTAVLPLRPRDVTIAHETIRVAFMAVLGMLGWALIVAAATVPRLTPQPPPFSGWLSLLLFFLVLLCGRLMAFRIFPLVPHVVVTPDAAFYVAVAVCVGAVPAALMVALALTLDAAWRQTRRLVRSRSMPTREGGSPLGDVAFCIYYGGVTGALLLAISWLLNVDGRQIVSDSGSQSTVLWLVPAYGLAFIVTHYAIQGGRLRLEGFSWSAVLRGMVGPGILVEASLLPLASLTVLVYRPREPMTLLLLGATYLLISFVFNRLSAASSKLTLRVDELETLQRTGRALASSLDLPEIIERVCRETAEALPPARRVALSLFDDAGRISQIDSYDREKQTFQREPPGLSGQFDARLLAEGSTIRMADVRKAAGTDALAKAGVSSWVGVPLRLYDRVIGLLEARSPQADAFDEDQVRLLRAIAAQASMAVQNARLYALATVDGLTGLYVRRYFDHRLLEEWQRSRRFQQGFSLILLDFDDFKVINDTAGHQAGDRVLRETAGVLRLALRGIDIAARYGGEEFAIILPSAGLLEAHAVAERVNADLRQLRVEHEGRSLTVTASMGVASYPESGVDDPTSLVQAADLALYRAKAAGKNRVECAWPPDENRTRRLKRPT